MSTFSAVSDLIIHFVYFKDWTISQYSDTLTLHNIIATQLPIHYSCFLKGTPVKTDQGIIPINKIIPRINTIDNKKIVAISKTISLEDYLVCIEKDALGENIPSQQTIISAEHRVLYNNKMMKAKTICELIDNVYKINYNGDTLYNVLMKNYDKMNVNNLTVETLHPHSVVAKLYSGKYNEEEKRKIIVGISNNTLRR